MPLPAASKAAPPSKLHRNGNSYTDCYCALNRGKHLSYQRGKRNTNPNTSLIKIEGVDDPKSATFYLGKRIAYVYRGKKEIRGTKIRVIWGKVTRTHGMLGPIPRDDNEDLGGGWWMLAKIEATWLTKGTTGNSGVVRAQFKHNLPTKSFGAMVRIMLYPSSI